MHRALLINKVIISTNNNVTFTGVQNFFYYYFIKGCWYFEPFIITHSTTRQLSILDYMRLAAWNSSSFRKTSIQLCHSSRDWHMPTFRAVIMLLRHFVCIITNMSPTGWKSCFINNKKSKYKSLFCFRSFSK